jgi:hypothetical protein
MKLTIVVKQKEEKTVKLDKVRNYFYTKHNLEVNLESGKKHLFKMGTVLELQED